MPPAYLSSLFAYQSWIDMLVDSCGGVLREEYLDFGELVDADNQLVGLNVAPYHIDWHDRTCLRFRFVVDENFVLLEYNFHFQTHEGRLIWRKDKQPGHEATVGLTHIHINPDDPDERVWFPEVDFDEALEEVHAYHESGWMPEPPPGRY